LLSFFVVVFAIVMFVENGNKKPTARGRLAVGYECL
jgi:hypothetical protein